MDLDNALAQADPMAGVAVSSLSPEMALEMKEFTMTEATETIGRAPAPRIRRRSRRRVILIGAIAAMAVAVPVAAMTGGLHTGIFASANETEQVPGKELLDLSDPGVVDVVKAEAAEVPLPPGASYDSLISRYPLSETTYGQVAVLRTEVEYFAQCRWYGHWLSADPGVRTTDADAIAKFVDWKFMDRFAPGDSGPAMTRALIAAVQRGDEGPVREFIAANC